MSAAINCIVYMQNNKCKQVSNKENKEKKNIENRDNIINKDTKENNPIVQKFFYFNLLKK
jgi:hypothetical protein